MACFRTFETRLEFLSLVRMVLAAFVALEGFRLDLAALGVSLMGNDFENGIFHSRGSSG